MHAVPTTQGGLKEAGRELFIPNRPCSFSCHREFVGIENVGDLVSVPKETVIAAACILDALENQ